MEAEKVSDLRPQIVPRKESMKAVLEIRPRFVWGRRRPRGRFGYHKYPVVVSRGCYPAAKPHLRAPTLDEFPIIPLNISPPTGDHVIDKELEKIALLCGFVSSIRQLIFARSELMMTSGIYLKETLAYWKRHDRLLNVVEALRDKLFADYGFEAAPVPTRFYHKF